MAKLDKEVKNVNNKKLLYILNFINIIIEVINSKIEIIINNKIFIFGNIVYKILYIFSFNGVNTIYLFFKALKNYSSFSK